MRNWLKPLIINIICFAIGIIIGTLIVPKPIATDIIPDYIDSLNNDRDSIYIVIDSIVERIIYIEKNYEENVSNILSNSDSTNLCYFTEYLEYYNNK
jgi:hypothetical protein